MSLSFEVEYCIYEEEVERLRSQVVAAGRRELDSWTEVANLKKALDTSKPKAVEAYKSY